MTCSTFGSEEVERRRSSLVPWFVKYPLSRSFVREVDGRHELSCGQRIPSLSHARSHPPSPLHRKFRHDGAPYHQLKREQTDATDHRKLQGSFCHRTLPHLILTLANSLLLSDLSSRSRPETFRSFKARPILPRRTLNTTMTN